MGFAAPCEGEYNTGDQAGAPEGPGAAKPGSGPAAQAAVRAPPLVKISRFTRVNISHLPVAHGRKEVVIRSDGRDSPRSVFASPTARFHTSGSPLPERRFSPSHVSSHGFRMHLNRRRHSMRSKLFSIVSVLVLLSMVLSACGGGATPAAQPTTAPVATTAPAATTAPGAATTAPAPTAATTTGTDGRPGDGHGRH
jgi:hypothetical protein